MNLLVGAVSHMSQSAKKTPREVGMKAVLHEAACGRKKRIDCAPGATATRFFPKLSALSGVQGQSAIGARIAHIWRRWLGIGVVAGASVRRRLAAAGSVTDAPARGGKQGEQQAPMASLPGAPQTGRACCREGLWLRGESRELRPTKSRSKPQQSGAPAARCGLIVGRGRATRQIRQGSSAA